MAEAAKLVGAGCATIALAGAGAGIGIVCCGVCSRAEIVTITSPAQ